MLNNYIQQPSTELPHLPQTNGNLPIMRRSWCSLIISNASCDVARVETVAEQSDSESGRHRAAPETERRNQIQKPLLLGGRSAVHKALYMATMVATQS